MIIITDERCTEYTKGGHPERPARVLDTLKRLREQQELPITWVQPDPAPEQAILRAHDRSLLESLHKAEADFDSDTPSFSGIYDHALRSAGGALRALEYARKNEDAFVLMRPPGHHALRDKAMGFCYLCNSAIAAFEAQAQGIERVAVYDFDVHHGNGTEAILLNCKGMANYSIHQYPCYPGTGTDHVGNNGFNYPVAPNTSREEHCQVLAKAFEDLKLFKPDLVIVSAGFDAYARDPLAQENLEVEDFYWLGEQVRQLQAPRMTLLEGGYSNDLPELVLAFLKGWAGK